MRKKSANKKKLQVNGGDKTAEQKTNSPVGKKQKRKSDNAEEPVKGKKQKIEAFTGTKSLENNEKKVVESKEKPAANVEASPAKKNKRAKKRLAVKMRNARINEAKEKLQAGGDGAKELAGKLKAIVDEKQTCPALKISITAAKKLLYFHKHGTFPKNDASIEKKLKKKEKKKLQQGANKEEGSQNGNEIKTDKKKKKKNKKQKEVVEVKEKKKENNENDESDYDVETNVKVDKVTKKMNDEPVDESEDEEVGEENDSAEESEEMEKESPPPKKKQKQKKVSVKETLEKEGLVQKGQSRYVLYVCNLPYDTNVEELKQHFTKTCEVKHVRIPTEKGTNKSRGFGYVEFNDEASYQKGLSLHHSMLKSRRIQVQYTMGGKKKGENSQKVIQQKNLKLHAMRKKGMLTTDVKDSQKKAARKAKRKHLQPKANAE